METLGETCNKDILDRCREGLKARRIALGYKDSFVQSGTFSSNLLVEVIESSFKKLNSETRHKVIELGMIAKLLDDLLDDYNIPSEELKKLLTEQSLLRELSDFISTLSQKQRSAFIEHGSKALDIAETYNQKGGIRNRMKESDTYLRVYIAILMEDFSEEDLEKIFHKLSPMFRGSYMLADLKDLKHDNRNLRDSFLLILSLLREGTLFIARSDKIMTAVKLAITLSCKSIMLALKPKMKLKIHSLINFSYISFYPWIF